MLNTQCIIHLKAFLDNQLYNLKYSYIIGKYKILFYFYTLIYYKETIYIEQTDLIE